MNNWKTIPNFVTAIGIFLTIGYAYAFLSHTKNLVLPLLIAASLTDFLDGLLARALNQRSRVGFFLDPIRDKLLLLCIWVNLVVIYSQDKTAPFYGQNGVAPLAGIATLEISCLIIIFQKGFPRPIHWMGKMRGFTHFLCSSIIIASTYVGWPASKLEDVHWLLFPMLAASFFARWAYMVQKAPSPQS